MSEKQSQATIKDVAQAAGVSLMTVTRAYRPEAVVAEKTRQRVFEIAKQLEYWPNLNAQALRGGKTMSIGILMSDPMSDSVVRMLSEKLMDKGYVSYIADSLGDMEIVEACLRDFRNRNVDGCVLGWREYFFRNHKITKLLSQIKNVILFSPEDISCMSYDSCQLSCDNTYMEIINYLNSSGRKRIMFLGRSGFYFYKAIENALKANNALTSSWHCETSNYPSKPDWENFIDALKDRLETGERPDAILTSSDFIAAKIIKCLADYGLRVPEDIAVIGKDNSPWGTLCPTPLATIDLQKDDITKNICDLLFKRLDGVKSKPKQITISAKFICRESAD